MIFINIEGTKEADKCSSKRIVTYSAAIIVPQLNSCLGQVSPPHNSDCYCNHHSNQATSKCFLSSMRCFLFKFITEQAAEEVSTSFGCY